MNIYAQTAMSAVSMVQNGTSSNPIEAWEKSTAIIIREGNLSQKKGCPKGAFLGLCEEGLIKCIPPGNYCSSEKNKGYAVKAVKLLKENPNLLYDKNLLWNTVVDEYKHHNSQMDIVIALWLHGLIA